LPVPTPAVEPLVAVISGDGVHWESRCLGKEERCGEESNDGETHFDVLVLFWEIVGSLMKCDCLNVKCEMELGIDGVMQREYLSFLLSDE
jgi:hypothetical protein